MSEIIMKLKKACSKAKLINENVNEIFIPKRMLAKCIFFSWRDIVYEVSKLPNYLFKLEGNIIKAFFWFNQVQLEVGFVIREPEESTQFALYYIKKVRISHKFANRLVEMKECARKDDARNYFAYSKHYYEDRLNNPEYENRNFVIDNAFFDALESCRPCYMEHFKMTVLLCSDEIIKKYGARVVAVIFIRDQYEVEHFGFKPYKIVTMYPEDKKKMGVQQ